MRAIAPAAGVGFEDIMRTRSAMKEPWFLRGTVLSSG
jgi:hypothetical protein